ncbi:MAG TPA: ABC transporter permease [Anaerolineaceae bacterium]|nr:ABC transporter permease [Anaerolineaceae bacterium]
MYRFIAKRILIMIPIILGVSFIIFAILSLTPGDPGRLILGNNASQEAVDQMNEQLGFYDPFLVKYLRYVGNALQGDFGRTYRTNEPVFAEILLRLPVTLKLVSLAILIGILFGMPIGIMSAIKQYSLGDYVSTFMALFFASIPSFWLGFMAIIIFSLNLKILPSSGIESWKGYILPSLVLGFGQSAVLIRLTRSSMLEVIRQDYIRTARAKGVYENLVIYKHALLNALIPIVTVIGMSFASGLGGTILIETVFGIPGVGLLLVEAIRMKDIPLVMGGVLLLAVIFSLTNLLVDLLYGFLDPRIRSMYVAHKKG